MKKIFSGLKTEWIISVIGLAIICLLVLLADLPKWIIFLLFILSSCIFIRVEYSVQNSIDRNKTIKTWFIALTVGMTISLTILALLLILPISDYLAARILNVIIIFCAVCSGMFAIGLIASCIRFLRSVNSKKKHESNNLSTDDYIGIFGAQVPTVMLAVFIMFIIIASRGASLGYVISIFLN